MTKKLICLLIVSVFIFSAAGVYGAQKASKTPAVNPIDQPTVSTTDKTKDRASRAMNNIFYGPMETASNINETNTKGTAIDDCTQKTRSGVERGIARVFAGVWQLATFWYSDPGCVTSTAPATAAKGKGSMK